MRIGILSYALEKLMSNQDELSPLIYQFRLDILYDMAAPDFDFKRQPLATHHAI